MQISFTSGPSELPRLPVYRVLVLADLDPDGERTGRTPIRIDRGGFNAVLDQVAPVLALDLDNALSDRAETWWLKLRFHQLTDFTPRGLLRQVPELDWIDRLRRGIDEVAAGKARPGELRDILDDYSGIPALARPVERCRRALDEAANAERPAAPSTAPDATPPPRAAPEAGGDAIDRLLDIVDTGAGTGASADEARQSARSAVSGAIAAMGRKAGRRRPMAGLEDASAQVTAVLERQLRLLLAHPRFIALEQTWRGLRWLLQGVGGDAPVDVQLLPCRVDEAAEALGHARPTATADDAGNGGFDLILVDTEVGPGDLDLLGQLSTAAEQTMAPVLITLRQDFFETPEQTPLARVRDPANLLDQPGYQRWNARREDPAWRWLAGCFNDMLLRAPYAEGSRHGAGITQPTDPMANGLWAHAGWLVARRIIEQQQQSDWPVPITGAEAGRIQDLDLIDPGDGAQRPLRNLLAPDQTDELGSIGIIALACAEDQDSAWITTAPSLLRIKPQAQPEVTRGLRRDAGLPYQLIRARLAHCIIGALDQLPGGTSRERATSLQRYAGALVSGTGPSAAASVDHSDEHPDRYLLAITVGERVLRGLTVEMQLDLGA